MISDVETEVEPPQVGGSDESDEGERSLMVRSAIVDVDDVQHFAGVQVFDDDCGDHELIAEAILRVALGLARLYHPDVSWAVERRILPLEAS